jgi:predicted DNA-binding transcriptional regulator YafY
VSAAPEKPPSVGAIEEVSTERVRGNIRELAAKVGAMRDLVEVEEHHRVQVAEALGLATSALGMAGMLIDLLVSIRDELKVSFTYSNHRGAVERRTVRVLGLRYGSSVHYKEDQWLMRAWCYDRRAERDFSLKKITDYPG